MQTLLRRHWHELPAAEVLRLTDTDPDSGLDKFEIVPRKERFGPNELTARRGESPLLLFLLQFHQPLVYILLAAAAVTAVLKEWVDAVVIGAVVLLNALIGFVQEAKARKAIEALSGTMTTEATVIRAGLKQRLAASELVPGDLVLLQSGDRVPADLRLLRVRELQVDESSLTGESVPVQKEGRPLAQDTPLADRANMAYASTLVTYGTAAGVVVQTGDDTEIGQINELISTADVLATPLTRKISSFSRLLLFVILGLAGLTFAVGALRGEPAFEMFMAAVALSVGAIPEGLPAALTITLALGVSKMARRQAVIRRLPAVETLGSTTVICSDKTGTLTRNEMTVQAIVLGGGERFTVTGTGYAPEGAILSDGAQVEVAASPGMVELLRAGMLCNDARLVHGDGDWRIEGDPTEGALLTVGRKAGLDVERLERDLPRMDAIPFESERQYMATLHDAGRTRIAYVKGAIEQVLSRCAWGSARDGSILPLDARAVHDTADELASHGLRVLAFARGELPSDASGIDHDHVAERLVFLGLQGMIDPPRAGVVEAIRACQHAGIAVKMITGDHARTAAAIAAEIGLEGAVGHDGQLVALTGRQMARLRDDELIEHANRTAVFARVAPEQKLRLVRALQSQDGHGHVVAMTGDGVNDAPALRQADIGIAMGIMGTEVAKESADMVLADDDFASIEAAVEEGRGVYDNLVKFITWTLPTNIGEGLVILVAVLAGLTLPILPVQILWINMTTAVLLGLMLAFEAKEPGIMERPPRDPRVPILTRTLLMRIGLVGFLLLVGAFSLFEYELAQGESLAAARTAAVNVFIVGQLFYLFNCRSLRHSMFRLGVFSNRWLLGGVLLMTLFQLGFTYLPFMHVAFSSAPIGAEEWGIIVVVGLVIYAVVGAEKTLRLRLAAS